MPVHTTDHARCMAGKLEKEQEEICLRENFRYLHESFVGPRATAGETDVDDVLENFCITLGFFTERCAEMSFANKYEAYRCFHASNLMDP